MVMPSFRFRDSGLQSSSTLTHKALLLARNNCYFISWKICILSWATKHESSQLLVFTKLDDSYQTSAAQPAERLTAEL